MNKLFFPQGTLSIEDNKPAQEIAFMRRQETGSSLAEYDSGKTAGYT